MKRLIARRDIVAGLALIIGISFGTAGISSAQQPKKGGTLVFASVSGPGTLDPHLASSAVELEVIVNVFESLVTLDGNNATRTMLASKATVSEDFKSYAFEL